MNLAATVFGNAFAARVAIYEVGALADGQRVLTVGEEVQEFRIAGARPAWHTFSEATAPSNPARVESCLRNIDIGRNLNQVTVWITTIDRDQSSRCPLLLDRPLLDCDSMSAQVLDNDIRIGSGEETKIIAPGGLVIGREPLFFNSPHSSVCCYEASVLMDYAKRESRPRLNSLAKVGNDVRCLKVRTTTLGSFACRISGRVRARSSRPRLDRLV
jgi:hypothetical protein